MKQVLVSPQSVEEQYKCAHSVTAKSNASLEVLTITIDPSACPWHEQLL